MNYIIDELLKHVNGFNTSHEAWCILERNFTFRSRARTIQLKEELQNFKKRNFIVNDYILKINVLYDELESIRWNVTEEEKLMYVLDGLDDTFDSVLSTLIE